ncbi:hypothetical protein At1D132_03520 [Agrobacterium fabrum]|nr:hypothetical protein At1D132_03520 [Agrobacterium fabrum]
MAVGMKRGREGPIPGLYPAPSKGHLGLRTSLPRSSEYMLMRLPAQSYPEHFQHSAGLRFGRTPLRLIDVLRAAIVIQITGIAAVGRKMSTFEDHEPPCASKHFVDPDCAMTTGGEAVGYVALPLVLTFNGFAVFLNPNIARILAATGLLAGAAILKAIQIIRRRWPVGCIRKTAHCGYNCQRQNLPHYPFPLVAVTCTIKRPQTRVKGFDAPSFIHG